MMKTRNRLGVGLLLAAAAVLLLAGTGAAASIAVVDVNQVFEQHPALGQVQMRYQEQAQEMEMHLQQLEPEEQQQMMHHYQQQLEALGAQLQNFLDDSLRDAIQAVAESNGIDLVFDVSALLHGGEDITEAVAAELAGMDLSLPE